MSFTEDDLSQAKTRMLGEFSQALANAEVLRKAEVDAASEDAAVPREPAGKKPAGTAASPAAAPEPVLPDR